MDENKQATNFINAQAVVKEFGAVLNEVPNKGCSLDNGIVSAIFKDGKLDKTIFEPLKVGQIQDMDGKKFSAGLDGVGGVGKGSPLVSRSNG